MHPKGYEDQTWRCVRVIGREPIVLYISSIVSPYSANIS